MEPRSLAGPDCIHHTRPFTPSFVKALRNADFISRKREMDYVDTLHLLLGLLEDNESAAMQIIVNTAGYDVMEEIRKQANKMADDYEGKTKMAVRCGRFSPTDLQAGLYCKDRLPGCFCKTGYPLSQTCPHCREWQDPEPEAYRGSHCLCPPKDGTPVSRSGSTKGDITNTRQKPIPLEGGDGPGGW